MAGCKRARHAALASVIMLAAAHAALALRPAVATAAAAAASLRPSGDVQPRQPPRMPASYSVNYTLSMPYTKGIPGQPLLTYPVSFMLDARGGRLRLDLYGGETQMIQRKGKLLEVVPRLDRQACLAFDDPSAGSIEPTALPDVTHGWQFGGQQELNGEPVELWRYEARHEAKLLVYRFYATLDGVPRRLDMHGSNALSGAHFDHWVVEYTGFQAGRPDPSVFATPELCRGVQPQASRRRTASQLRLLSLVPAVRYGGDGQYDAFLATHGASRLHRSLDEYERRRGLFHANRRLIEQHNAGNHTYTLAMNRFGDWSREELVALMLPKRARRLQQQSEPEQQQAQQQPSAPAGGSHATKQEGQAEGRLRQHPAKDPYALPYEPLADPARLPRTLTWRGTGADAVVYDQANCGSCWTFAAAGAMEGAWFRATGQQVSFSQQQLLDCSWGYRPQDPAANLACDGGDPDAAIGHIAASGGIATLADYPYKGADGLCRANATRRTGKFKGYARLPRYDDDVLREALYSRGPLAISFDASRPTFAFYSSGVYFDPDCKFKSEDLDHSMLLVGYGTDAAGDYWEVKNSWSEHWGEGGYFRVLRDGHACGIPSDAMYAVADA